MSRLVASSRLSTRTAGGEALDVGVLDVAAVLAQMDGDAVGAGGLAERAASSGSGSSVRRACRTVAT